MTKAANIFCVRDDKVGVFMPPMVYRNEAEVCRVLSHIINGDQPHALRDRTAEYSLYEVGHFDDATGAINCSGVTHIMNLVSLKETGNSRPSTLSVVESSKKSSK